MITTWLWTGNDKKQKVWTAGEIKEVPVARRHERLQRAHELPALELRLDRVLGLVHQSEPLHGQRGGRERVVDEDPAAHAHAELLLVPDELEVLVGVAVGEPITDAVVLEQVLGPARVAVLGEVPG